MFRVFGRTVWKRNDSWPDGYEPQATPMDKCRTYAKFATRKEAIDCCDNLNHIWRKYSPPEIQTPSKKKVYFESPRYEFTEI